MVNTQNLSFAFGGVWNRRVEGPISATCLAMIFLLTSYRLAILDDVFTLTFRTAIYNYLSYHVSMIPSVRVLPLPFYYAPSLQSFLLFCKWAKPEK